MNKYLSAFRSLLNDVQKNTLEKLLKKEIKTSDVSKAVADLLDEEGEVISKYIPEEEGERLSHTKFNEFRRNILVDLEAAFSEAKNTESALMSVIKRNESAFADLMSEIDKLTARVNALESMENADDGSVVFSFDFSSADPDQVEMNNYFYEGRSKSLVTQDEGITLFPNSDHTYTVVPDSSITARVEAVERLGKGGATYATALSRCLNADTTDFWLDVILTDYPILGSNYSEQISWLENTSYKQGAAIKLKFSFPSQIAVSEIVLYPIAPFPLEVLKVEYITVSATPTIEVATFIPTYTQNKIILSLTAADSTPFIPADTFYITLNQPNYVVNSYLLDKNNLVSEKYYEQLQDTEALQASSYLSPPTESWWNEEAQNPYVTDEYVKHIQEWSDWLWDLYSTIPKEESQLMQLAKDLGGVLLKTVANLYQLSQLSEPSDFIRKTKYEYVYGLREVEFRYREYDIYSRYVSNQLKFDGECRRASISFEASDDTTSTDVSYLPKDVTFWLSLRDDSLGNKILLPGDGSEVNIDVPTDIDFIDITEEFIATSETGEVNLGWWPYIDFDTINNFVRKWYPRILYNPNLETYTDSSVTVATIPRPVSISIRTPSGATISPDTLGAPFSKPGTPVLVEKTLDAVDNTILSEITVSEVVQLFSDPAFRSTLSDFGYTEPMAEIEMERRFFRSNYRNWVSGVSFDICIYHNNTDYTSITLPVADVLYERGIIVFRERVKNVIDLAGVDTDLSGVQLQLKAYNFYYVPSISTTPTTQVRGVPFTQNKTNYDRGYLPDVTRVPFNNDYSSPEYYPVVSYTHKGRTLKFNRVFKDEEGYLIRVSYRTLRQSPRLIIDMQRLTMEDSNTPTTLISSLHRSPIVTGAQIKLKTIRA